VPERWKNWPTCHAFWMRILELQEEQRPPLPWRQR